MDIEQLQAQVREEVENLLMKEYKLTPNTFGTSDIPEKLEHSMLGQDLTREKILKESALARQYGVAAICVSPYYVPAAFSVLYGTRTAVCAAVGFPQGAMSHEAKLAEIRACTNAGATELDIALNMLAIKSGEYDAARRELCEEVAVAGIRARVKAVYEQGSYTPDERRIVLQMIADSGAEFVKIQNLTSGHGARVEDVAFVRGEIGDSVKIKIDGGVKTLETAESLLSAGADRIGLTATEAVAKQALGCRRF
ncbi:MAG: deoxyribose-phosphate aldolase [Oscillospiraceae bacterium]|nr:deoxyribose-phosphate aldolase [Oscillospiraceae bacterium]